MKNKKAMDLLGEHTVNLVIAVLSIVVLIMLGTAIYNLFLGQKSQLAQAKSTLNSLSDEILALQEGKIASYPVFNPKDWWMVVTSATSTKSVICMCPKFSNWETSKQYVIENCPKEGTCKEINRYIQVYPEFMKLSSPLPKEIFLLSENGNVVVMDSLNSKTRNLSLFLATNEIYKKLIVTIAKNPSQETAVKEIENLVVKTLPVNSCWTVVLSQDSVERKSFSKECAAESTIMSAIHSSYFVQDRVSYGIKINSYTQDY